MSVGQTLDCAAGLQTFCDKSMHLTALAWACLCKAHEMLMASLSLMADSRTPAHRWSAVYSGNRCAPNFSFISSCLAIHTFCFASRNAVATRRTDPPPPPCLQTLRVFLGSWGLKLLTGKREGPFRGLVLASKQTCFGVGLTQIWARHGPERAHCPKPCGRKQPQNGPKTAPKWPQNGPKTPFGGHLGAVWGPFSQGGLPVKGANLAPFWAHTQLGKRH